jgi:hypothetical protein
MIRDPWAMSRGTALALNAVVLLAYGIIAVVARPWAAFAGFLLLGALIRMATALYRALVAGSHEDSTAGSGLWLAVFVPALLAMLVYTVVFVALWFIGDYWKVVGVIVCGYIVYASLFALPGTGKVDDSV